MTTEELNMDYSKYDFKDSVDTYTYLSKKGLTRETIKEISKLKNEPSWMRDFRLRSYDVFMDKPQGIPNDRAFGIKFNVLPKNIQIQMQTKNITPLEAIGLLEMAKDQLMDNLKKGRKEVFSSFKKGDDKDN